MWLNYNPHTQKQYQVLNNYGEYKGKIKSLRTAKSEVYVILSSSMSLNFLCPKSPFSVLNSGNFLQLYLSSSPLFNST